MQPVTAPETSASTRVTAAMNIRRLTCCVNTAKKEFKTSKTASSATAVRMVNPSVVRVVEVKGIASAKGAIKIRDAA